MVFIIIVLTHWIADFVLQAEEWALGKSKSLSPLLKHTSMYSVCWFLPTWLFSHNLTGSLWFVAITFVAHTVTDYFTSKIVSKRFADNYYGSPIPNFGAFSMIGLDQVLHYLQLIITWYYIFGLDKTA